MGQFLSSDQVKSSVSIIKQIFESKHREEEQQRLTMLTRQRAALIKSQCESEKRAPTLHTYVNERVAKEAINV